MEVNQRTLKKVVKYLEKLKKESGYGIAIKTYFYDEENYVIKFIDTLTEKKIKTIRKRNNSVAKTFDSKGYYKGGIKNEQKENH